MSGMKNASRREVADLVDFGRDDEGCLFVRTVKGHVNGSVMGDVLGDVEGHVWGRVCGTISGRIWQFVETPKEKIIRLIREGKSEEAIKVLEELGV